MRRFRHVAETPLIFDQLALNAAAFEKHFAAGGLQQSGDDVDGGAFPGSIRAQIAEHLIRLDGEAHVVDRGGGRIALGKRPHLEHGE